MYGWGGNREPRVPDHPKQPGEPTPAPTNAPAQSEQKQPTPLHPHINDHPGELED